MGAHPKVQAGVRGIVLVLVGVGLLSGAAADGGPTPSPDGGATPVAGGGPDGGIVDGGPAKKTKEPKAKEVEPWAKEPWKIVIPSNQKVAAGRVRVQTPLGRPITLEEGTGDVGQEKKLSERAYERERLESGLRAYWVERIIVFAVAGLLAVLGVMALGIGLSFVTVIRFRLVPPAALRGFTELPRIGPALVIIGSATLAIATLGAVVGGAMTAFLLVKPPPPDDRILDEIGSTILWDLSEAKDVVKQHNRQPYVVGAPAEGFEVEIVHEGVMAAQETTPAPEPATKKATKSKKSKSKKSKGR